MSNMISFPIEYIYIVLFLILLRILVVNFKAYLQYKKEVLETEKVKLDIDIEKTDVIIDALVNSCLDEYIAYNPQLQNELYINSTIEKEMVTDITKLIIGRISPTLLNRLSLCYHQDEIGTILSRKVYLRVILFEIEHENGKRKELERAEQYKRELPESE